MLNKGESRWGQVGWWKKVNGVRQVFVQYVTDGGAWPTLTWPGQPVGSTHNYRVRRMFEDSVWRWKFYRDSATLATVSTLQWVPTKYQLHGETHSRANQMPGGTGSHMHFWSAYYYVGDSLTEINSAPGTTEGAIHGASKAAGGVHYEIWDKACAN